MRLERLLLLTTLLAGCEVDSPELGTTTQEIVGGTPVGTGADPAVVLVNGNCSGTLITPKVVLTAAHCVVNEQTGQPLPTTGMQVTFTNATQGPSIPVTVLAAEALAQNKDIAVLGLAQAATVTPIPFNRKDLAQHLNQPIRIVGFGATSETDQGPPLKRQGSSTLLGVGPLGTEIHAGEMYSTPSPQGTCYGDSGGPSFMTVDGKEVVVGVTSRGGPLNGVGQIPPCGQGYDVSVRPDSHAPFIDAFIAQHDPQAAGGGTGPGTGETGPDQPGGQTPTGEPAPGEEMNLVGGCSALPGAARDDAPIALVVILLVLAAAGSRRTSPARPASPRRRS